MKMKQVLAGVAAAATLLSGLALSTVANAENAPTAQEDKVTFGTTITLKGSVAALTGRSFKAVKLADYGAATIQPAGIAVTTTTNAGLKSAIETALTSATSDATNNDDRYTTNDDGDAMAWVAQHINDSSAAPWSGQLRKFVQNVAASQAYQQDTGAGTWGAQLGGSGNDSTLEVSGLSKGLYLITDSTDYPMNATDTAAKTWTRSIPILVGTGVFKDTAMTQSLFTNSSDGTVVVKNNEIPLIKTVNEVSIPNNKTAKYTVDSKVPNYVGYKKDTYTYKFVDNLEQNKLAFPTEKINNTDTVTAKSIGLKVTITLTDAEQAVTIDPTSEDNAHSDWYDFTDASATSFTLNLKKFIDAHASTVKTKDDTNSSEVDVYALGDNNTNWSGATVTITYNATVLDAAYRKGADNDIKVQYSNNPSVDSTADAPNYTEREDHEKVFNFNYKIVKKDKETGTVLSGAQFKLTRIDDNNTTLTGDYAFTDTKETGNNGEIEFTGLAAGKYLVEETAAPADHINAGLKYYLTITPTYQEESATKIDGTSYQRKVSVTQVNYTISDVTGGGWVSGNFVNNGTLTNTVIPTETTKITTSMDVLNATSIAQLPLTGAAGTVLFTVIGLLLAGGAGFVYARSRSVKSALAC
ncbi:LPXTG cell wall anchor domain-containing protein [Bifidobacterium sp. 82T10]|uniref:LPXTG cell wall anchor domain-containing protein n=1 Tax=Bifidobacterium miconis TaxID=2834435 RepID=A0ABS6WCU5_9BIFI|nr:SpaA isopeptide-forming pilin-related protein [Bifidobacterium miconis]MBW3091850.1 LPXTG cell wall anchor domain-containing protein [Bifidobacterium miconis]